MEKIEIRTPEGYQRIEKVENGVKVILFEKIEETKVDFDVLKEKIAYYRECKGHDYYIGGAGNICDTDISIYYNHNTEADIKAQQLQLIFKGLVEMYSDELDLENQKQRKNFLYYDISINKILISYNYGIKYQGTTYASSEEILKRVVSEMGEENVLFMLKNLR